MKAVFTKQNSNCCDKDACAAPSDSCVFFHTILTDNALSAVSVFLCLRIILVIWKNVRDLHLRVLSTRIILKNALKRQCENLNHCGLQALSAA